jgi:flavin-dependent dehydrogenase
MAQAGCATLLIEGEKSPRFRLGDPPLPETYGILRRLGVLDSFQNRLLVHQGEGVDFDGLLLGNAAARGAACHEQTRATDLILDGERVLGARLQTPDGVAREVRCRVLVDATGRQAFLANQASLPKTESPQCKTAIWGHYRGACRDAGEPTAAGALPACVQDSWFWFIPLSEDITSIGVVGDSAELLQGRRQPAEVFEDELVKRPDLAARLMNAELASQLHVTREFLYVPHRAGEGWVALADAFGFSDSYHPLSVFFTMKSGELAADAIVDSLARNDFSARRLEQALGVPQP